MFLHGFCFAVNILKSRFLDLYQDLNFIGYWKSFLVQLKHFALFSDFLANKNMIFHFCLDMVLLVR